MMHPKIVFPGAMAPVIDGLSRPLYERRLRDDERQLRDDEISLADGYRIEADAFKNEPHLDVLLNDLRDFMQVGMGVSEVKQGFALRLHRAAVDGRPADAAEAHRIVTHKDGCTVTAEDMDGLRRAIYRLQEHMQLRRAPFLPIESESRWTQLRTRIVRSPIAPYRWLSGWELEDDNDYYPDAYLARLAHAGINGLWIPGLIRNMVASKTIPELGPNTHRLGKLQELIDKAERYGIRIYLFCIEPRALSDGHPAGQAHPEILGPRNCLCMSVPLVKEYLREVMQTLFTEVPKLAGIINIPCGERFTSCWSSERYGAECPRCSTRPRHEVLAETLNTFVEGIHAAKPSAEFIAWTYMMDTARETAPIGPMLDVMSKSDKGVIWMGNFEHGCTKKIFGKQVTLHEYSLSCVGPSDYFRDMVKASRDHGLTMYAKMQIGASYELSSVPFTPVPGIAYEKLKAADEVGAKGTMLGWIPGGFPSPLLTMVADAAFEPRTSRLDSLRRVAAIEWGEHRANVVAGAWQTFADAWQCYPFDNGTLYWGPITRGVAYQLHLEREERLAKPYNWGYTRKREPQPFEDKLDRWLGGVWTVDEVTFALREIARMWNDALSRLESVVTEADMGTNIERQMAIARAVRLQCLAAANVYEFYDLRDKLLEVNASEHPAIVRRMYEVAEADLNVAQEMLRMMAIEPSIGFQSEIFDFSFSKSQVEEKILQVSDLLPTLKRWEIDGIETEFLTRTVEEAEWLRPDRIPDRWGD